MLCQDFIYIYLYSELQKMVHYYIILEAIVYSTHILNKMNSETYFRPFLLNLSIQALLFPCFLCVLLIV